MSITFRLPDEDQPVSSDEARWLLGQLRSARELTADAAAAADKIEQSFVHRGAVETTLGEQRALIEALERGSTQPRSRELRRLEIALHAALYSQTYLDDQSRPAFDTAASPTANEAAPRTDP